MKSFLILTAMTAVVILTGCAGGGKLVLDPVGPAIDQEASATAPANGALVVYSAYRRSADFNARDSRRPEYSDYKILTSDGNLLQKVHNNSGTMLEDAVTVELSPGKYNVVARANVYGFATIPVVIAARQTTVLHLEGGDPWPNLSVFNQTNAVRLPDGQIVGWKD